MPGTLTVGERIVLHLSRYSKLIDVYEAPIDISQDGIAAALRISRAHAALELKKLKEGKEVSERLSHIKRGKTKRKVYFLTRQGEERAKNINQFAEDNSIDLSQYQDIRKCRGPELWKTLDEKHKPVVSMSCVFRRPFRRDILPEIERLPPTRGPERNGGPAKGAEGLCGLHNQPGKVKGLSQFRR